MNLLLAIIACVVTLSIVIIATIRKRLKVKSNQLSEQIKRLSLYSEQSSCKQAKERLSASNNGVFVDIPTALKSVFCGKIISTTQENDFTNYYNHYFQKANSLLKKLEVFNIAPSGVVSKFINDFRFGMERRKKNRFS